MEFYGQSAKGEIRCSNNDWCIFHINLKYEWVYGISHHIQSLWEELVERNQATLGFDMMAGTPIKNLFPYSTINLNIEVQVDQFVGVTLRFFILFGGKKILFPSPTLLFQEWFRGASSASV